MKASPLSEQLYCASLQWHLTLGGKKDTSKLSRAWVHTPVPSICLLLQSMSDEAVVLLQVVDLHQPAPVQLTLPPGVLPVTLNVRDQVLVTCLTNKQLASMLKRTCDQDYLTFQIFPVRNSLIESLGFNQKNWNKNKAKYVHYFLLSKLEVTNGMYRIIFIISNNIFISPKVKLIGQIFVIY